MDIQPVRILDKDFFMLAEIADYESLLYTRAYDTFGGFELRINQNKKHVEHLKIGAILYISPERSGIIQSRELSMDTGGKKSQTITIRGFTLEHLLTYRIVEVAAGKEVYEAVGKTEDVLKNMVSYNIGALCTNKSRVISEIEIAASKGRGIETAVSACLTPLNEECQRILSKAGMGLKITLDYTHQRFLLDVYEGRLLTTEQDELPPVIFSEEFDNISSRNFINSLLDYKNTAIVVGKESGLMSVRSVINDEKKGLERREILIDAGSLEKDSVLSLADRGMDELSGFEAISALEGTAIPFSSFCYGKDYGLGDVVTVRFQDGNDQIYIHTRIVEVTEIYDETGAHVEIVFGQKVPTVVDKIKRIIKGKG